MNASWAAEAIGYLASALIIVSITQTSILRLRLIGLAGSLTFVAYGIVIGAFPIALTNGVVAGIHIWNLRKLIRHQGEVFRVLHVQSDSRYLLDFLDFYRDEIQGRFQPEFVYEPDPDQVSAFVLRDMVPAGLFIGRPQDDGSFRVDLDFVIPQYRDFRVGRYVYSDESALLTDLAPSSVWTEASNPEHAKYLHRVGFAEGDAGRFEITV